MHKNPVILYHASCPDGFGAAYAAWKKFGDAAEYIPLRHGDPAPANLDGRVVYFVDFSYPKQILLDIERRAERLVVLDHHMGAKADVEAVREHVFDNDRSGSGITWDYFHSGTPLPRLLAYIQDNDIWKHELPQWEEVGAFISTIPLGDFEKFDGIVARMQNETEFACIQEKGAVYAEYFSFICNALADKSREVEFEGQKVFAVNISAPQFLQTEVGHILANRRGPFGIVWSFGPAGWNVSLRGNGEIDLAALAQKFGGNGHHNAAGFQRPANEPLPFTFVK